ncbi:MAG TPA: chitinase [Pseudonocardiaceae bacterium]|jgi:chitinase|nr:chitinase [Pseudonocardiaceae bacterium]
MARNLRRSLIASAIALLPAALVISSATTSAAAPAAATAFPTHFSAPYLQIGSGDTGDLAADLKASGDKYYTLAFLTSKSGCTLQWEDGGDAVGAFKSQISSLQSAGGNVAASFGGAGSKELAETCTSVSSLAAAYGKIVSTYGITRLDFDIEGNTINNTAATSRRDQALAQLQKSNKSVQVDFTLPVDPTGLESNATNVLKDAKSKGVAVSVVNIMTMDFGDGQNALKDAESGANATHGQLQKIYTGDSSAQVWGMLGLTPIAGKNDDNENFTQANAKTLEGFAKSNGVGELAFWEVDQYDKPLGYAYSKIFNAITG